MTLDAMRPTATLSGDAVNPANTVLTTIPQLLLLGNKSKNSVRISGIDATNMPTRQRRLGKKSGPRAPTQTRAKDTPREGRPTSIVRKDVKPKPLMT